MCAKSRACRHWEISPLQGLFAIGHQRFVQRLTVSHNVPLPIFAMTMADEGVHIIGQRRQAVLHATCPCGKHSL